MNISFEKLSKLHFSLLLKWLEAPHVKQWWDQDIKWTEELIEQKYNPYVQGYKLQNGKSKKLHAFIINVNGVPVGYIQIYNAYDFPRSMPLIGMPSSLAAIDIFIGEKNYIGKNIGSKAMQMFLDQYYASDFEYTFVDPDVNNIAAIKSYEKSGFNIVKSTNSSEVWMLRKNIINNSHKLKITQVSE